MFQVRLTTPLTQTEAVYGQTKVKPPPIEVECLVDSGAGVSVVSRDIVTRLRLEQCGRVLARGFDGKTAFFPKYSVEMRFPDSDYRMRLFPICVENPGDGEPHMLLGRDAMTGSLFQYNGLIGSYGLFLVSA